MNNILNKEEIADLKVNGHKLALLVDQLKAEIKPGVTADKIETLALKLFDQAGLTPAFLNYYVYGAGNFPASTCISVNEEVVHGIPLKTKVFKEGDLVSIDLGAGYNGVYTDMAVTVPVGEISDADAKLLKFTEDSLYRGIEAAKSGNTIGHIGEAVEKVANLNNLGIVRDYVGHGIGRKPHLPPQIPNYGEAGEGITIAEGMALAIEPMLTLGRGETDVRPDGWTVVTSDHSKAAHFEHTIIIENGLPVIITKV
ncbi:MAG: type I methionyl aminopeptidase [Patescibacteria group bacterium]|jgi:methionyl aminopeptidase